MTKDKHPTERVGRNPKITSSNAKAEVSEKKQENSAVKEPSKPGKSQESLLVKIKSAPTTAWNWFNNLSRNTKLALILSVILVIVGVSTLILIGGNSNESVNQEEVVETENSVETIDTTISLQQGTLEIKNDSGEWIDVPADYTIQEGDVLRTVGATSRSVIAFADGSELRMDANTEVEFLTLRTERIVTRHTNGYTYSRVIADENRAYIVESSNAQYEAQGTAFKTAASGDEQSVEVFHSSVHETVTNQKPNEGEKLTVKSQTDPSKDGKIEKLDIEQVKQDQFMTWNKQLDEQNELFKDQLGFLKDFDAPEITITSHKDGDTVLLDSNATEATIEFTGNTEKGAKVTVQSKSQSGSQAVDVSVDDGGNFTTPVLSAPLGNSVFEFISSDRTGNKTTLNIRINFQRKSAPIITNSTPSIISLTQSSGMVNISWTDTGNKDGYKVVWSKSSNPKFDSDFSQYAEKGNSATIKSDIESGEKYYFSVCEYDKDKNSCSNYSSSKSIEIE